MFNHTLLTLSGRLGHTWPTRIDLWTGPISPHGRRCPAGLHTTDTLWHACIDFLTYSDYHPSRQSGLCPSGERSQSIKRGNMRIYRSFPAVLKWLRSGKGYTMLRRSCLITLSGRLGHTWPTRIELWTGPISPRGWRCAAGLHTADTLWHACIDFLTYSDYHPSRQSGLCPSGERSRLIKRGNMRIYRSFPAVLKWLPSGKG